MKKVNILILLIAGFAINAQSLLNFEDSSVEVQAEAETGFVYIINHTIQNGSEGTNFNYVTQGGQDVLFPVSRFNLGLSFEQSSFQFLYQPLEVVTNVEFRGDVTIDGTTFVSGTPMEITYSFPFWRATYLYDFIKAEDTELSTGLSLQIRNASLRFKDVKGDNLTVSQNIGPVPALSFKFSKNFNNGFYLNYDLTGSYASSALFNGASFTFEGSLLDTSLRAGLQLKNNMNIYLGARFLGGSATGNSEYVDRTWSESQSPYTDNKLATLVIFAGVRLY